MKSIKNLREHLPGLLLGLIMTVSLLLAFGLLRQGHHWGDDFAGYIGQAIALVENQVPEYVRRNGFSMEQSAYPGAPGPAAYGWGFPLVLAPVYKLAGLDIMVFKAVGLVFWGLFLAGLYHLNREYLGDWEALPLTAIFAFALSFLQAVDEIMADVPALALVTWSMVLARKNGRWQPALAGLLAFFAMSMRQTAGLVMAAVLLELFSRARGNLKEFARQAVLPLGVFFVCTLVYVLLLPGGESSYLTHLSRVSWERLLMNAKVYYAVTRQFFLPVMDSDVLTWFMLAAAMVGLLVLLNKKQAAWLCFAGLFMAAYLVWPYTQGIRYIYPVYPFFLLAAYLGIRRLAVGVHIWLTWLAPALFGILALFFLAQSGQAAVRNLANGRPEHHGPFDAYATEMMSYIREQTPEDAVILYVKPRIVALLTGRMTYRSDRCQDLPAADYVFLNLENPNFKQVPPDKILECPGLRLEQVLLNERLVGYRVLR